MSIFYFLFFVYIGTGRGGVLSCSSRGVAVYFLWPAAWVRGGACPPPPPAAGLLPPAAAIRWPLQFAAVYPNAVVTRDAGGAPRGRAAQEGGEESSDWGEESGSGEESLGGEYFLFLVLVYIYTGRGGILSCSAQGVAVYFLWPAAWVQGGACPPPPPAAGLLPPAAAIRWPLQFAAVYSSAAVTRDSVASVVCRGVLKCRGHPRCRWVAAGERSAGRG